MLSLSFLTHRHEEQSSCAGAALLDGGGVVVQADAGHGDQHQQQGGQPQQARTHHQGARRLHIGCTRRDGRGGLRAAARAATRRESSYHPLITPTYLSSYLHDLYIYVSSLKNKLGSFRM